MQGSFRPIPAFPWVDSRRRTRKAIRSPRMPPARTAQSEKASQPASPCRPPGGDWRSRIYAPGPRSWRLPSGSAGQADQERRRRSRPSGQPERPVEKVGNSLCRGSGEGWANSAQPAQPESLKKCPRLRKLAVGRSAPCLPPAYFNNSASRPATSSRSASRRDWKATIRSSWKRGPTTSPTTRCRRRSASARSAWSIAR